MIAGCLRLIAAIMLIASAIRGGAAMAADSDFQKVAQEIDRRLAEHWQAKGITPAAPADDWALLKRVTLDLTGRIPTRSEWEARLAGGKPLADRYPQLVQELIAGPEFSLHLGAVLDEMLQGPAAGSAEFIDYLRRGVRAGKPWDAQFRELLVGPWDNPDNKPAMHFLGTRTKDKDLDRLTIDATRVFFGVDVSCARCHDHPLVDDWKQDHYYGMASFFSRTVGGKGAISEKTDGDVTFKNALGEQKTAQVMFLSGRVADEPPTVEGKKPKVNRREQLVAIALADKTFLSRSIVNRLWQQLLGRGVVHPVDQMHSANPPSVPGLLEWLADDFAASGYDLQRLAGAIVTSRAYRLSSQWQASSPPPAEGDFAVGRLGLLSPRQYAMSLLVATERANFAEPDANQARAEKLVGATGTNRVAQYLTAEQQAAAIGPNLDPGQDGQTSAAEALFLSNNAAVQTLVKADANTLTAKLAALEQPAQMAEAAIRAVYCRPPAAGEADRLAAWIGQQGPDKAAACEQLVWVLVTSAEFRFKH